MTQRVSPLQPAYKALQFHSRVTSWRVQHLRKGTVVFGGTMSRTVCLVACTDFRHLLSLCTGVRKVFGCFKAAHARYRSTTYECRDLFLALADGLDFGNTLGLLPCSLTDASYRCCYLVPGILACKCQACLSMTFLGLLSTDGGV